MWVLIAFLWGSPQPLTMHDFGNQGACQNAERLMTMAAAAHGTQITAYCTEQERSLLGKHDDAPATQ